MFGSFVPFPLCGASSHFLFHTIFGSLNMALNIPNMPVVLAIDFSVQIAELDERIAAANGNAEVQHWRSLVRSPSWWTFSLIL